MITVDKCCDKCRWYNWYYDFCDKWHCVVDGRNRFPCFEWRGVQDDTK